jgi:hypothetical protein
MSSIIDQAVVIYLVLVLLYKLPFLLYRLSKLLIVYILFVLKAIILFGGIALVIEFLHFSWFTGFIFKPLNLYAIVKHTEILRISAALLKLPFYKLFGYF